MSMLCDRMCATKKMVSIFRHGINNDDIGPIAKASFEETPEMFLKAARHAELDNMRGISGNVMCGQEGYFGTNSFQVLLNINKLQDLPEVTQKDNIDIKLFLTAGSIWQNDYTEYDYKIRSSAGISLDFITAIGPISFTYAKPISKDTLDNERAFTFSIGTSF